MPELVAPTTRLHAAWLESHAEWGPGLRHGDDDYARWAGHIGYGIRPSARRRGLAMWALGRMLDEARALGLERVLAASGCHCGCRPRAPGIRCGAFDAYGAALRGHVSASRAYV